MSDSDDDGDNSDSDVSCSTELPNVELNTMNEALLRHDKVA
jgi:hypothetical protein